MAKIWIAFGNPTQNTGRFRDCFGRLSHRWITRQIDSRSSSIPNKKQIQDWIDDYGEDSDFVRVRVKGEFPRASVSQFIPGDVVDDAMKRFINFDLIQHQPVVIGVDVSRFGDDESVICVRKGLKVLEVARFQKMDTMSFAGKVADKVQEYKPTGTFIDVVGIGAGVVDRLRQLQVDGIFEVNAGLPASKDKEYYNKRAEMWDDMRKWLKLGDIPKGDELKEQLIGPEYGFDAKNRLQLERKEDMKKRGLKSPDIGDALAHTFFMPFFAEEVKPKNPLLERIEKLESMDKEGWQGYYEEQHKGDPWDSAYLDDWDKV